MTVPAEPMVHLSGISKVYAGATALRPTDLDVRRGEFLTLLGPSGSGKSTLLNIISGMISPTTGTLKIDGRDVTAVAPSKRGIGMVFQNYALMPHMTVFENVAFPLQVRGVSRKEIRERVSDALRLVRLPEVADRRPRELSGGQQQRISIARCIVYNPSLILMDEPLGALDKALREQMQLEIRNLHASLGITMMYVTHDQDEALSMSDRIMLMNGGAIEQIGSPQDLYDEPASQFAAAFIGQSSFLHGEVAAPGTIRLRSNDVIRYARGAQQGKGTLMLRPEDLTIGAKPADPQWNHLDGCLTDTLVAGGIVKHFVELDEGTRVLAQQLATRDRVHREPGSRVSVAWRPNCGLFLSR